MKRSIIYAFTLATAVALSACGFQLRGSSGQNALPFKTIYLGFPETSPVGTELRRYIRADGETSVVSDPKVAQAVVELLSESREKSILTLNTQGRPREYTLLYRVRFRVRDGQQQKELMPPTEIILKRDITFNESQALAKEKEEEMLYRDMQSDLVQQILRRLSALRQA